MVPCVQRVEARHQVLEGSYAKHLRGESKNPTHGYLGFTIDRLLGRAQRFAV